MRTFLIVAALLTGTVTAGCGGQTSASVASNGYGSGAVIMLRAHLRGGTPGSAGAALSRKLIAFRGVVFTNYLPPGELVVGLDTTAAVGRVAEFLRRSKEVLWVSQGPAPTAPPVLPTAKPG